MKVIRTKQPITIGDRTKRDAIVAVAITEWTFQEQLNRFKAMVVDFEVVESGNTEPGTPLKNYIPITPPKPVIRTPKQVNDIFNYFAVPIETGDDYTMKNRDLIVKGLLMDTQQDPIYNTTPEDWEIIDTDTEVVPTI